MSGPIEYHNLKPSDYDDIIRVWSEAGLKHRAEGRDARGPVVGEIKRSPELYIGAFEGDKLIGTVIGTYDGRRGCVNRLAVVPGFRKQGIAEKLVALCEEQLKRIGARIIYCLIDGDNDPSLNLFKKLGYKVHEDILYLSKRDEAWG